MEHGSGMVGGVPVEIDGMDVVFGSGVTSAADILALAGRDPVGAHLVVRLTDGRAWPVESGAAVLLDRVSTARFRTFANAEPRHLLVDGRAWVWGASAITVADVLDVAGAPPGSRVVRADRAGEDLDPVATIQLDGDAPVEMEIRKATPQRAVQIVVNGLPREWAEPTLTFDELVRLAHPGIEPSDRRSLTVVYRHGPLDRPEGTLVESQSLRLEPGATFNVLATDKG